MLELNNIFYIDIQNNIMRIKLYNEFNIIILRSFI